jgi:hypothetical protein
MYAILDCVVRDSYGFLFQRFVIIPVPFSHSQVFKKDLTCRGIITAEQERTLFSNVEELEELNRCDVLAKFEARFKAVQETGAALAVVNLGDIFLQLVWNENERDDA